MKFKFLSILVLSAALITSCTKESIDPDNDGIADGKQTINYSVQVIGIGELGKGLSGAEVTLHTQGGTTTKTVNSDGIAVFENINAGTISGYVRKEGYASVNFTAFVSEQHVDVNTNKYASSTVYIPAMNSAVRGRLYGDFDLDGTGGLSDPGNFKAINVHIRYYPTSYPMGSGDGGLTNVSLDVNTYVEMTATDGNFTIDSLPNTDLGYFGAGFQPEAIREVDAVTGAQVIFNFPGFFISLPPGSTTQLGDLSY